MGAGAVVADVATDREQVAVACSVALWGTSARGPAGLRASRFVLRTKIVRQKYRLNGPGPQNSVISKPLRCAARSMNAYSSRSALSSTMYPPILVFRNRMFETTGPCLTIYQYDIKIVIIVSLDGCRITLK